MRSAHVLLAFTQQIPLSESRTVHSGEGLDFIVVFLRFEGMISKFRRRKDVGDKRSELPATAVLFLD